MSDTVGCIKEIERKEYIKIEGIISWTLFNNGYCFGWEFRKVRDFLIKRFNITVKDDENFFERIFINIKEYIFTLTRDELYYLINIEQLNRFMDGKEIQLLKKYKLIK